MCTLIALFKAVPGYAVVVGMNRDEMYDRPSSPPETIHARHRIIAPRDDRAGGTWVGMNESGVVVALANRRVKERDPGKRSRGLLVLEALAAESAADVGDWLRDDLDVHQYNPFNLFSADKDSITFHMYEDGLESVDGKEGVNVLVNEGANLGDEVFTTISGMVTPLDVKDPNAATEALKRICSRHEKAAAGIPICKHDEKHGTVSSTIIALNDASPWASHFLYADGCPCHNIYRSYTQELRTWFAG